MKSSPRSRWLLLGAMAVVWIGLFVRPGHGAEAAPAREKAREFVAGLRERKYYDTAIEYLELAKNNPNVDKEFKEAIDFEAGVILVEESRTGLAKAIREEKLADAWKRFTSTGRLSLEGRYGFLIELDAVQGNHLSLLNAWAYNPDASKAYKRIIELAEKGGYEVAPLREVCKSIFVPARHKRKYVSKSDSSIYFSSNAY